MDKKAKKSQSERKELSKTTKKHPTAEDLRKLKKDEKKKEKEKAKEKELEKEREKGKDKKSRSREHSAREMVEEKLKDPEKDKEKGKDKKMRSREHSTRDMVGEEKEREKAVESASTPPQQQKAHSRDPSLGKMEDEQEKLRRFLDTMASMKETQADDKEKEKPVLMPANNTTNNNKLYPTVSIRLPSESQPEPTITTTPPTPKEGSPQVTPLQVLQQGSDRSGVSVQEMIVQMDNLVKASQRRTPDRYMSIPKDTRGSARRLSNGHQAKRRKHSDSDTDDTPTEVSDLTEIHGESDTENDLMEIFLSSTSSGRSASSIRRSFGKLPLGDDDLDESFSRDLSTDSFTDLDEMSGSSSLTEPAAPRPKDRLSIGFFLEDAGGVSRGASAEVIFPIIFSPFL